jgi:1-acyl-sn-glycerol-3-phosphate acyltransferase
MIGSLVFTTLLFVTVPPYALAAIVARIAGTRASYAVARAWARLVDRLARALCGLHYTVEGVENLPPGSAVAMIKHSSAYETIMQLLIFPQQTWVLKRELMWAPFFGWALAALAPIAIDRGGGRSAVDQVLAQGKRQLEAGRWVMIFPEGTRMAPGETRRYGLSGALLAAASGRFLVPVAHDAGDYWPRRGLRKRPGTVRFCIGKPVDPAGREARQVTEEIQAWIEAKVAELRGTQARPDAVVPRALGG